MALEQRRKARDQTCLQAFLNLGAQAELYGRKLREKRLNAAHHIQKIVALSQLYGQDKVVRALEDALAFDANLLEQRERHTVEHHFLLTAATTGLSQTALPQSAQRSHIEFFA